MAVNPANYRLGAGELLIGGTSIGSTSEEGITVTIEPNLVELKSGKYGETPVKVFRTGYQVTAQVVIAEQTLANWNDAIAGSTQTDGKLKVGGVAGTEVTGQTLELDPFDGTQSWLFRKAVPTSSVELAYKAGEPRYINVTFKALVDVNAPEDENIVYAS